MEIINRSTWKGWDNLPHQQKSSKTDKVVGNTGKYPDYQTALFQVVNTNNIKKMMEIGFNAGHSSCCLLNAAGEGGSMLTFDLCEHSTHEQAMSALSPHFNIKLIPGSSFKTVPEYFSNNDELFDLIFVDGAHWGDGPEIDIVNVKNRVKSGGYLVIDDMHIGDVAIPTKKHIIDSREYELVTWPIKFDKRASIFRRK